MTYSIIARDPTTGHVGIAVASRFFAAGSIVPTIKHGIGAVCSQAFASPLYGAQAIALQSAGMHPRDIISSLTSADEGSAQRQLHLMDYYTGRNAAFTGKSCIDWAGHEVDSNVSVAGNMLVGPRVVTNTLKAFQAASDLPLSERLLVAMQAGENAGGDKRGKQSAGMLVYKDQDYPWLDLRVDDHADPLAELRRLYDVAHERFLMLIDMMPTRENPHGCTDRRLIDAKIEHLEAQRKSEGIESRSFATPL